MNEWLVLILILFGIISLTIFIVTLRENDDFYVIVQHTLCWPLYILWFLLVLLPYMLYIEAIKSLKDLQDNK